MRLLVAVVSLFACAYAQVVTLVPLINLENPTFTRRRFFTGAIPSSITWYKNNGYTKDKSTGATLLLTKPDSNICKYVTELHEIFDKNYDMALSTLTKAQIDANSSVTYQGLAGYLATEPAVCGASAEPLIEYYSITYRQHFYMHSVAETNSMMANDIDAYPVRVMGYVFNAGTTITITSGSTPLFNSPFMNRQPVKLSIIIRLTHPTLGTATTSSRDRANTLISEGYTEANTTVRDASVISDGDDDCIAITESCGTLVKLYEIYNTVTKRYSLSRNGNGSLTTDLIEIRPFGSCPLLHNSCGSTQPVYEMYNAATKDYAYSFDTTDFYALVSQGYVNVGALCYVKKGSWEWMPVSVCQA